MNNKDKIIIKEMIKPTMITKQRINKITKTKTE